MRTRLLVLLMTVAIAAGCGASVEDPAAVPSTPTLTTPAATGSSAAPITPATPTAPEACGNVPVTTAMLADAQFAFIGTAIAADEEIHPWTTDPENPDRPGPSDDHAGVTFTVDHRDLNDWGVTAGVGAVSVATGDHVRRRGCRPHARSALSLSLSLFLFFFFFLSLSLSLSLRSATSSDSQGEVEPAAQSSAVQRSRVGTKCSGPHSLHQ